MNIDLFFYKSSDGGDESRHMSIQTYGPRMLLLQVYGEEGPPEGKELVSLVVNEDQVRSIVRALDFAIEEAKD